MTRYMQRLTVLVAAVVVLGLAATAVGRRARSFLPFEELKIYLEENATDGDLGLHFLLDGEAWSRISMAGPDGCRIFSSRNKSSLKEIGSTELFHESAEPEFEELSREDFLALHPEGEYTFSGRTIEGDTLMGTALLSHAQPLRGLSLSPLKLET